MRVLPLSSGVFSGVSSALAPAVAPLLAFASDACFAVLLILLVLVWG